MDYKKSMDRTFELLDTVDIKELIFNERRNRVAISMKFKEKAYYRGYKIVCVGYYNPEHKVCWECVDENGCGFGHDYSLKACKRWIDIELDGE